MVSGVNAMAGLLRMASVCCTNRPSTFSVRASAYICAQFTGVAQPFARGEVEVAHLVIGVGEDDPALVGIGTALRIPAVISSARAAKRVSAACTISLCS